MEINIKEIHVSENDITGNVKYKAVVNGNLFQMQTDGFFHPHLTFDQWKNCVEEWVLNNYTNN